MNYKKKVLFILKQKENNDSYSTEYSGQGFTTGLLNSATYVSDMLDRLSDIESKLVIVTDNNDIDREVTSFKPTHVIIEALWVVPEKFETLTKLHPEVKWVIRIHSELPFISNESVAFEWMHQYLKIKNVSIGVNSQRMEREMEFYFRTFIDLGKNDVREKVIYLPNYYPNEFKSKELDREKDTIDVGCFGAIRPLKNHLIQAFAAVMFAEKMGKKLNFHINVSRVEQRGESVLKNLESLFDSLKDKGHKLVEHDWYEKDDFLDVCATMDLGMQCSLSETFNLVTADLISQGVPVVTSSEIDWIDKGSQVNPTNSKEIAQALYDVYKDSKKNVSSNKEYLRKFSKKTIDVWLDYLKNEKHNRDER
jgi:gas vesicle protein